jgi:hypothetical protein
MRVRVHASFWPLRVARCVPVFSVANLGAALLVAPKLYLECLCWRVITLSVLRILGMCANMVRLISELIPTVICSAGHNLSTARSTACGHGKVRSAGTPVLTEQLRLRRRSCPSVKTFGGHRLRANNGFEEAKWALSSCWLQHQSCA